MRWLIFLSRVAFLCGIMVILALSLLYNEWNKGETISSAIITSGYVLGMIVIPLINLIYLICWIAGKKPGTIVPRWLILFNVASLLLIFVYIFLI
ncbi:hypothetical protein [Niabella sp.]|uniref:hypothetical protein n=1 Tax=Niabella sp. TaxID=1962976 RepID=UPI0026065EA6|nr:hypothetical protein [Niabella sp.]